METNEHRLARLRADIAAGTYAPPVESVAESLVGWIARPEQFERPARPGADRRDPRRDGPDRARR